MQPDNFHRWKPPNNRAIGVLTKWISLCRGVIEKKFLAVNDVRCDWQTKNYLAWNVCYYDYNRSPTLFDLYTRFTMYSFQAKGIGPLLVASNESQILARTGQFFSLPLCSFIWVVNKLDSPFPLSGNVLCTQPPKLKLFHQRSELAHSCFFWDVACGIFECLPTTK